MNKKHKIVLAALLQILLVGASIATERLTLETVVARDSDNAKHDGYYLKYRNDIGNRQRPDYWGFGGGVRRINDRQGSNEFSAITAEFREPLTDAIAVQTSATKLNQSKWSPWTGNLATIITPNSRSYSELFAERDIVDTTRAIEQQIRVNTYGISSDYRILPEWTVVGALFRQRFSDGNERTGKVARLLWEISSLEWMLAEIRVKELSADFNGDGYFSPDHLRESLALITLRTTIFNEAHALTLQIGGGSQQINRELSQDLYLAEFKARGWFSQSIGHETKLGCKNTGDVSFAAQADDYRYCYSSFQLHYAW